MTRIKKDILNKRKAFRFTLAQDVFFVSAYCLLYFFQLHPERDGPGCFHSVEKNGVGTFFCIYIYDSSRAENLMQDFLAYGVVGRSFICEKVAAAQFNVFPGFFDQPFFWLPVVFQEILVNVKDKSGRVARRTVQISSFGF